MPVITDEAPLKLSSATAQMFPIREVARLTGINPVTLRAWERRYGLIEPTRTESGHRLYTLSDIETVRSILGWIERGVAVSKVGKILARAVPANLAEVDAAREWSGWQERLIVAVRAFDEAELERLYGQIFSIYPLTVVFQDILLPLWRQMSTAEGFGCSSEWLFFDNFLRMRVTQRLHLARSELSSPVLLASLPGHSRELELQVAGLMLGSAEVRVQILSCSQPFDELSLVCERLKPRGLILFSSRAPVAALPARLGRLAQAVNCPVFLAGEVADMAEEGLTGSAIGCLGSDGRLMQTRLQRFLAGTLDT